MPENVKSDSNTGTLPAPPRPRVDRLPQWKVLLHNDPVNDMLYVVTTLREIASLNHLMAIERILEAHKTGVALLLLTHREKAELLQEQFTSKRLKTTIEPEA